MPPRAMRPIAELLDFLRHTMTMQTIYQPAVILHLLTRDGWAPRSDLATTLSGYDEQGIEDWDRVLMKNPKSVLVDKHEILTYDKSSQTFRLDVDLSDRPAVEEAIALCEEAIADWIDRAARQQRYPDAELLRLYRVAELARWGDAYAKPAEAPCDFQHEEAALQLVTDLLRQRYPNVPIRQQPVHTVGFNILVGSLPQPVAYVNVKATPGPSPTFWLSEGERIFSLRHADCYILALVYQLDLATNTHRVAFHHGPLTADRLILKPQHWQAQLKPDSHCREISE